MGSHAFALAVFVLTTPAVAYASSAPSHDLPDSKLTPGMTDPAVTQANIQTTICVSGYTATVRPPTSYTNRLKSDQLNDPKYRYKDRVLADYEEDHLVPLELGGNPRDPKNLWPELYAGVNGARVKDQLEDRLKRLVCSGVVSLQEAQAAFAANWMTAYRKYIH